MQFTHGKLSTCAFNSAHARTPQGFSNKMAARSMSHQDKRFPHAPSTPRTLSRSLNGLSYCSSGRQHTAAHAVSCMVVYTQVAAPSHHKNGVSTQHTAASLCLLCKHRRGVPRPPPGSVVSLVNGTTAPNGQNRARWSAICLMLSLALSTLL